MPDLVRDLVGLGVRVHAVEPVRISLEDRLLAVLRHEAHAMTALTVAGLTLREAFRRLVWALLLTVVLLGLSGTGLLEADRPGHRAGHHDQR